MPTSTTIVTTFQELKVSLETQNNTVVSSGIINQTETINIASGVTWESKNTTLVKSDIDYPSIKILNKNSIDVKGILNIIGADVIGVPSYNFGSLDYSSVINKTYIALDIGAEVLFSNAIYFEDIRCFGLRGNAQFIRGDGNHLGTTSRDSQIIFEKILNRNCYGGYIDLPSSLALGDAIANRCSFYQRVHNYKAERCRIPLWQSSSNFQGGDFGFDRCSYVLIGRMGASANTPCSSPMLQGYQPANETGHGRIDQVTHNHATNWTDNSFLIGDGVAGDVLSNTRTLGHIGTHIIDTMPNIIGTWVQWFSDMTIDHIDVYPSYKTVQHFSNTQMIGNMFCNNFASISAESEVSVIKNPVLSVIPSTRTSWDFSSFTTQSNFNGRDGLFLSGRQNIIDIVDDVTHGKVLVPNSSITDFAINPSALFLTSLDLDTRDSKIEVNATSLGVGSGNFSIWGIARSQIETGGYQDFGHSFLSWGLFANSTNATMTGYVWRMGNGLVVNDSFTREGIFTSNNFENPMPSQSKELMYIFEIETISTSQSTLFLKVKESSCGPENVIFRKTIDHTIAGQGQDWSKGKVGIYYGIGKVGNPNLIENQCIKKIKVSQNVSSVAINCCKNGT